MAKSSVIDPVKDAGNKGADMAKKSTKKAAKSVTSVLSNIACRFVQDKKQKVYFKMHVRVFATVCGLMWGVGLFAAAWWVMFLEGPKAAKRDLPMSRIYLGYKATPMGALCGLAWGIADGFFGGAAFAWLYNKLTSIGQQKIEIQI